MPKSIPALINPAMLAWAREQACVPLAAAATSIGVTTEKLAATERGETNLTFAQFLAAANTYKRAPSLFYLEEPPAGFKSIQDFRLLSSAEERYSPALTAVIRQACERRELALALHADLDEPAREFTLGANVDENEEELAARIRSFLRVSDVEQKGWRAGAFEKWRAKIEASGALVFLIPNLPLPEMRGVAIAETLVPLILVNAKDRTNGRTFTLLHEFCHLAVRASGVSGFSPDDDTARSPATKIERFCNAVAAATLVPAKSLLSEALVVQKGSAKTWSDDELSALASRFGVSREVVLRRLLTLGRTTSAFYQNRRPVFKKEYDDLENKKSSGGPARHLVVLSQLGRAYSQLVFQGYYERRLTLRDVSNYLNMQVRALPAMEQATFSLTT